MGLGIILLGALIALICAWIVNALIGLMSGERPGGLPADWWKIFSGMGGSRLSNAEPLPDFLKPSLINVGDRVRLLHIPLDVQRTMTQQTQMLIQRNEGIIFRVERIDAFGGLELHVPNEGIQECGHSYHTIFIEPRYVELASNA